MSAGVASSTCRDRSDRRRDRLRAAIDPEPGTCGIRRRLESQVVAQRGQVHPDCAQRTKDRARVGNIMSAPSTVMRTARSNDHGRQAAEEGDDLIGEPLRSEPQLEGRAGPDEHATG